MNTHEIWKSIPIEKFSGYQVSNLGRVRNRHSKIMSQNLGEHGYYIITLYNGEKYKTFQVHRLVAMAFCSGYKEELDVNHIDHCRINNNADNLEWCTRKYNCNCLLHRISVSKSKLESNGMAKKVAKCNLNGEIIEIYKSVRQASAANNINFSNIAQCCTGSKYRHTAGGYKWKYVL